MLEMTGLWFETNGLCSKGWGCGSKWQARIRKDGVVFEMVGSRLKQWACI